MLAARPCRTETSTWVLTCTDGQPTDLAENRPSKPTLYRSCHTRGQYVTGRSRSPSTPRPYGHRRCAIGGGQAVRSPTGVNSPYSVVTFGENCVLSPTRRAIGMNRPGAQSQALPSTPGGPIVATWSPRQVQPVVDTRRVTAAAGQMTWACGIRCDKVRGGRTGRCGGQAADGDDRYRCGMHAALLAAAAQQLPRTGLGSMGNAMRHRSTMPAGTLAVDDVGGWLIAAHPPRARGGATRARDRWRSHHDRPHRSSAAGNGKATQAAT